MKINETRTGGRIHNIIDFLRILYGKEIIYKGLASKKLEELIKYLGDQTLLNNWKKKAGV